MTIDPVWRLPTTLVTMMIQHFERLAQRRELVLLRTIKAKPHANRLQGHAQELHDRPACTSAVVCSDLSTILGASHLRDVINQHLGDADLREMLAH